MLLGALWRAPCMIHGANDASAYVVLLQQVELCFKTGEIILVYGDMDEDGFYMGELDGVRGLVPSNFLADAPDQYNNQMGPGAGRGALSQRGRGQGPGARGPPPPPRDNMMPGVAGQRGPPGKSK